MGLPVHRFLEDFTPPTASEARPATDLRPRLIHRIVTPQPTPQELEKQKLQDAFDRGVEHGMSSARAAAEAEMATTVARCEAQIEESRQAFAGALTHRLTDELRTSLDRAQAIISKQAATALMPFLRRIMTETAISELAGDLAATLTAAPALVATISGPGELLERLRSAITAAADGRTDLATRLEFLLEQGPVPQVTVHAGNEVIELRLAEWLARLDEAAS